MSHKQFMKLFFLSPLLLIGAILLFTVTVDPFNITGVNLLNIQYKMARDDRTEKIERIKKILPLDNLILGSSRAQHLDPEWISQKLGGSTYNFGVGGGSVDDALGLLLFLKAQKELPKNILLTLDFSSFNRHIPPHPSFFKLKELNFLSHDGYTPEYLSKFLSVEAVRASFKTIKAHIKGSVPGTYFDKNGYLRSTQDISPHHADPEKIRQLAQTYYSFNYSNGDYELSMQRMKHLDELITLCQENDIRLFTVLTPVHASQYTMIQNDIRLSRQLAQFKSLLRQKTGYCDAMQINAYTQDSAYFEDSVHFTKEYGDMLMESVFSAGSTEICTAVAKNH